MVCRVFSLCAKWGGKNRKKEAAPGPKLFFFSCFCKGKDVDDDKGQVIVVISTVSFVEFECGLWEVEKMVYDLKGGCSLPPSSSSPASLSFFFCFLSFFLFSLSLQSVQRESKCGDGTIERGNEYDYLGDGTMNEWRFVCLFVWWW